jgi:hypothetical protein
MKARPGDGYKDRRDYVLIQTQGSPKDPVQFLTMTLRPTTPLKVEVNPSKEAQMFWGLEGEHS